MTIREKLLLMKQINEANNKSIERFIKSKYQDTSSIYAMIRRDARVNSLMRDIVKSYILNPDAEKGGEE